MEWSSFVRRKNQVFLMLWNIGQGEFVAASII
jgi:hypothetical protein